MKRASQSPLATPAIDEIWRRAATTVGFALARTQDAYATSDGRGGIAIGATETLDGDDALAQLVFHELCHAITEGEASLRGHLKAEGKEESGSQSYVPADEKDDRALTKALDLLRGTVTDAAFPPNSKAAVPN